MNYKARIGTAIATASLLATSFVPMAAADIDTAIARNGADSTNTINVTQNTTVNVTQSNVAVMGNFVSGSANTGGNKANKNNDGDVTIDTGNATVDVDATNTGGDNVANVTLPAPQNINSVVRRNGAGSTNTEKVVNNTSVSGSQTGVCLTGNFVSKKAKTGKNKANKNNGGTVEVTPGNATATSTVGNTCGGNTWN